MQAWQELATTEAALAESQKADGISPLETPTNADLELVDGFIAWVEAKKGHPVGIG